MDEFDVYFQRAKQDTDLGILQQATYNVPSAPPGGRRGSVPNITLQPCESNMHHKRTLSCRAPSKRRGTMSPRGSRSPSRRSHDHRGSHSLLSADALLEEDADEESGRPTSPGPGGALIAPPESGMSMSRSGSFRKNRNPRIDKEIQELQVTDTGESRSRKNSLVEDDEATARLEQIRLLEQENLCVVRSFETSSRGIINRGDSVKKKKKQPRQDTESLEPMETVLENGEPLNGCDTSGDQKLRPPTTVPLGSAGARKSVGGTPSGAHRVLVIGDQGVGKTALINQFLTSDYMGAAVDSGQEEKSVHTVSVEVDGEETMMDLVELKASKTPPALTTADAIVLVYAIDERRSFHYVQDVLTDVRKQDDHEGAIIMVANKTDLVRTRDVEEEDALQFCQQYDSKFIEVSCALNHQVDEMLVGIVTQIRLNPKRRQHKPRRNPDGTRVVTCISSVREMLRKMFTNKKEENHNCDNLLIL